MSEELGLQQRVGDRSAIDVDKRFPGAFAVAVNCPRDELLSRATFADDEHRGDRARLHARDLLVHLQHRRRAADQAADGTCRRLGWRLPPDASVAQGAKSTMRFTSAMTNGLLM